MYSARCSSHNLIEFVFSPQSFEKILKYQIRKMCCFHSYMYNYLMLIVLHKGI